MLGRIKKIFISSILRRRPSIFKEVFLLGRIKRYLFLQICKEDQGYLLFKECFMLGRKIKNKAFWAISYSLL